MLQLVTPSTFCFAVTILAGTAFWPAGTEIAAFQSGRITGKVVDTTGHPLPGVLVTALPESGGIVRTVTGGEDGAYQFGELPDGTYRIDFVLPGFDRTRRNHVQVRGGETAAVDATLHVGTICECITITGSTARYLDGQVRDESGRPLSYARLEGVVSPSRREVASTDRDGRFQIRLSANQEFVLTVADSGFEPITVVIASALAEPLLLRLRHVATTAVPENERFDDRGCGCSGNLFTHQRR